ncbi:MAG: hypothetical protein JRN15_11220 [Nitrososphaerota archaeon]|nr:hypothetical protein [Nitrososphaerota archaeon]
MSSEEYKEKVRIAQEAVKGVDKDLRVSAFQTILTKLLESASVSKQKPGKGNAHPKRKSKGKTSTPTSFAPIPLNLKGGKSMQSLRDFYSKKSPASHQEKLAVFAYYINKYLDDVKDVLPGHVISCYNEVGGKKPLKIIQLFRDTKHLKGWLDNGEAPNSIRINIAGENLVEHDLPRPKK